MTPKNASLADGLLERVSQYVADTMGLHFPRSKWGNLERALRRAAEEFGFERADECAAWLLTSPPSRKTVEIMACHLTIGESYFLRETGALEVLEREILPAIVRARPEGERRLRVWSAGCATGEEPYTIAIMFHRMQSAPSGWDARILATDINSSALRKAIDGVYTEWSFRGPPPRFRENYFKKVEAGRYELLPHLKAMVDFSYLNLVEDAYPLLVNNTNAMDVIFCRNVLMYLTPEKAEEVIERFQRCLVDGGWLIVSPCETSRPLASFFATVNFPEAILYQKRWTGRRKTAPLVVVEPEPLRSLADEYAVAAVPSSPLEPEPPAAPPTGPAPLTPPSALETAREFFCRGYYSQAADKLEELLLHQGDDMEAMTLLCRALANCGKLAGALRAAEKALASDKLNAELHYLSAVILQEQGAAGKAAAALKKALYLNQGFVLAHFSLGNIALKEGKGKESEKHFGNALSLLGKCPPDEIVPESGGIPAGRLKEIIESMVADPAAANGIGQTGTVAPMAESKRVAQ